METRKTEILVGVFVAVTIVALVFLALRVASNTDITRGSTYTLSASFDNIGGLKVRSPVKIGGVTVGRVTRIYLEGEYYEPVVEMQISTAYDQLPETSTVSVLTSGLLGEQYLGVEPGFIDDGIMMLQDGDRFMNSNSAMVLEELIGQFLFSQGDN
ncbi:outer membrane lipid asymmetry maintenance protein MlaD [Aliidiomarina maris]|uniref:Outer membrane lipid asymmetry maintenance protein MlaD n=1 Tax=Aliidiomarina maris TaxID=531312 RepID=A0A327X0E9_9GAMM|nr:outer membrane lipid asymmetry maintenance protein MlaD [Aliidiomarina maris]MBA3987609.1 outer membrane lipid asymmetry maintenance protein MlaD [Idiomarina sp.]MCL5051396.1 outer membrane lipid asymmetry maintenance protein MlaD [Bacillota bacterium]RAJ99261.1 phospholipid/cholesterol/gamma-HCH transport system substrate-binding protein [Aliidiomarina maris]RUO27596.1 outer membrane lipid asymmetry maintenance protein MlaD [Aliidiomarina maris]